MDKALVSFSRGRKDREWMGEAEEKGRRRRWWRRRKRTRSRRRGRNHFYDFFLDGESRSYWYNDIVNHDIVNHEQRN